MMGESDRDLDHDYRSFSMEETPILFLQVIFSLLSANFKDNGQSTWYAGRQRGVLLKRTGILRGWLFTECRLMLYCAVCTYRRQLVCCQTWDSFSSVGAVSWSGNMYVVYSRYVAINGQAPCSQVVGWSVLSTEIFKIYKYVCITLLSTIIEMRIMTKFTEKSQQSEILPETSLVITHNIL
jgi:hypothetical protein